MSVAFSDLGKRFVGGGLLALVAGIDIWLGGAVFGLVLIAIAILGAREFARLTVPGLGRRAIVVIAVVPILALSAFQYRYWADSSTAGAAWPWLVSLVIAAALLVTVGGTRDRAWLWCAFGVLYIGLPLLAFQWLREADADYGLMHVGWLVAIVVATDTFAYLVGRSLGGPKLAPSISPGKTWSGLCGGVAGAVLVGLAFAGWMPGWSGPSLALLAAGLALTAQSGDLFESWLKRRAGRKDSGMLIPGHGGLLDRLDGYMTATPVFALLIAGTTT